MNRPIHGLKTTEYVLAVNPSARFGLTRGLATSRDRRWHTIELRGLVSPGSPSLDVTFEAPPLPCLVAVSDEAAETVAWDELLALQLKARRGRGVVGLEPLLDSAALVRMPIYLFAFATGRVGRWARVQKIRPQSECA
eukprot:scaffold62591_cov58-Phaeocystis_antarctica.AAC.5